MSVERRIGGVVRSGRMAIAGLEKILSEYQFNCVSEKELQDDLEKLLTERGIPFVREYSLTKQDRPDFFVDGVALEVKVEGSFSEVARQLFRYAAHDSVKEVILITTRYQHLQLRTEMHGKPVRTIHVRTFA